jgi:hypothetical protein
VEQSFFIKNAGEKREETLEIAFHKTNSEWESLQQILIDWNTLMLIPMLMIKALRGIEKKI